ncbi:tat pathway signal sequence [Purpureocillium lavendulum]|uniref:Tat pathway signal sequence n=1 Tax=Purpureocillium lavendulum TaxID=1247861 RepID=A0AB34FXN4_9HYPO|nr:tat pathway signal sequence [Purpureocillium lavendulum]
MSAPILGRVNHAQLELLNLERSPASGETAEDNQGSQNASKRWVKDAADSLQAALDEKNGYPGKHSWNPGDITDNEVQQNDLVASKWPLFLPALVAFIGDHDARVRERGLWLVSAFLHKLPTETLRHSGVGDVLQDAIFPTLASLPTLTPEHESAQLLRAAYPVLLQLALADLDAQNWHGWRVLDKILRDGVLESYSHASHYATIAEILMHTAASIVRYLGIRSARHLQVNQYTHSFTI